MGVARREEIFERFLEWMDPLSGTELAGVWHLGCEKIDEIYSTLSWPGHLIEQVLHYGSEFDNALRGFIEANDDIFGGPDSEMIAAAIEFDFLTRPYVIKLHSH